MNENNSVRVEKYNLLAQGFHWLIALLLLGLFVTNSIREAVPKTEQLQWLQLHISLGVLVFLLTFLRIIWGKIIPPPPMVNAPGWSLIAANLAHILLNLTTLLVPVFGYLRVVSKGYTVHFFGLPLPSLIGPMHDLHELMENIFHGEPMEIFFLSLIGIHIAAALWHQYVRRDNALRRVLPW